MKKEEQEQKPILIVGTVGEKPNKEIKETPFPNFNKIYLEDTEIFQVLEARKQTKEKESVTAFLKNKKERANALEFIERCNVNLPKGKHLHTKREIKDCTTLSWKQFSSVLDVLTLHGLIVEEENGLIHFNVPEDYLIQHRMERWNKQLDLMKQEIENTRTVIKDSGVKKKMYSFKRKLSLKL